MEDPSRSRVLMISSSRKRGRGPRTSRVGDNEQDQGVWYSVAIRDCAWQHMHLANKGLLEGGIVLILRKDSRHGLNGEMTDPVSRKHPIRAYCT